MTGAMYPGKFWIWLRSYHFYNHNFSNKLTEDVTWSFSSPYSVEELLDSWLLYNLLTIVKFDETIRISDTEIGITFGIEDEVLEL